MPGWFHKQMSAALIRHVKKKKKMLGRMFTLPTRQNHLVYTDKLRRERERKRKRACKLKLNVCQLFEINSSNSG